MPKKLFITSALPYVNNVPHLGNIIGCVLSGDVFARYHRLFNKETEVIYLCGTDEYGTTTEVKALKEKVSCQALCDRFHNEHKAIYDWFNINFDVWGRTTTKEQTEITHEIFTNLYKSGHIEEGKVQQFYCKTCAIFLADRYLKGTCYHNECKGKTSVANGDQCDTCGNLIDAPLLINPFCSICNGKPELTESDHLFLKLGDFEDRLTEFFSNSDPETGPFLTKNAESITKTWLSSGLHSRCITRDLKWGTSIPTWIDPERLDKYKDKVFYVWFDAPIGYLSILASRFRDGEWKQVLHDSNMVHVMSKDNVPFHSIVFSSTLMGASTSEYTYPLLHTLNSTEYLLYEGRKFSKSNGTGIFGDQVMELSRLFSLNEDYWRFYLVRIRPEKSDTSFQWTQFIDMCNADLIKNYGNFVNRCISMTNRYFNGTVTLDLAGEQDQEYVNKVLALLDQYNNHMKNFELRDGITVPLAISDIGNKFLHVKAPWNRYKEYQKTGDPMVLEEIGKVLAFGLWITVLATKCLEPFVPRSAAYILAHIGTDKPVGFDLTALKLSFTLSQNEYVLPFQPLKVESIMEKLKELNLLA